MRSSLAIALLLLVPAAGPAQPADTAVRSAETLSWTIAPSGTPGRVQFEISRRSANSHWRSSSTVDLAMLEGLGVDRLDGESGPVRFRVARDAGTLACQGTAWRGRGTGECSFLADERFAATLAERGIGRPSVDEQFSMTLNNIGYAYLDELQRQRYDTPTATDLAQAGNHGVTLAYLRDMGGHNYRVGRLAALIRMRDHGVTPDYIEGLARHDVRDIPAEEIVRLRDHGVSADYVGELRQLGYRRLSTEEMIRLRDHGVTPDYIRALAQAGIRDIPTVELTRMRDHGVRPDFVVALRSAGYRFGTDEIVRMRDHGVDEAYVSELHRLGYADIAAEEIVRMRIHGVTPDFIRRANGPGRRSPEELVRMRIGG
ncbi:MAG TPA: hypothetical protein VEC11_10915 [Allosphingosinicella sp.]|nr:hypothetical protein [Allosphingosinicella sp.]